MLRKRSITCLQEAEPELSRQVMIDMGRYSYMIMPLLFRFSQLSHEEIHPLLLFYFPGKRLSLSSRGKAAQ